MLNDQKWLDIYTAISEDVMLMHILDCIGELLSCIRADQKKMHDDWDQ